MDPFQVRYGGRWKFYPYESGKFLIGNLEKFNNYYEQSNFCLRKIQLKTILFAKIKSWLFYALILEMASTISR